MNILIPDSWLREYLKTPASPKDIKECLSLCGPSVERINRVGNDHVYDIEITSNRIDMASVLGIAREAAAILPRFNIPAKLIPLRIREQVVPKTNLPMEITDPQNICKRIMGVVLQVNKPADSPEFVKKRLEMCGVRSLNNLVDITNYVMLEVGHPCHVFDYDRIRTHKFILRFARKDELIITLDNKKYLLSGSDVIIDDGTGRVIDLPGIMGTKNSVVNENTQRIFFFIESNNPAIIRKTSMRYGIRTMAANINEKNPDPTLVKTALLRGISLYEDIAGGIVSGEIIDIYPVPLKKKELKVSLDFLNKRLGITLIPKDVTKILKSLNFSVAETSVDAADNKSAVFNIIPPTYRQFDIQIPEDVVEEVSRLYGYHNLPVRLMEGLIPVSDLPPTLMVEEKLKHVLRDWGFTEVYNYSFIPEKTIIKAGLKIASHLALSNPLTEDTAYMRTNLIPSILDNISKNQSISDTINIFELSKVYLPRKNNLPTESSELVIGSYKDFYEIKGIVEQIFKYLGLKDYSTSRYKPEFLNEFQSVGFLHKHILVASVGKLDKVYKENFHLDKDVYIARLFLDEILPFLNSQNIYYPLPTYPPAIEDLTMIMPDKTEIGPVLKYITEKEKLVENLSIINRFENKITVRITYRNKNKNITSDEIQNSRESILRNIKLLFGIIIRRK